jgi:hypothetical protein
MRIPRLAFLLILAVGLFTTPAVASTIVVPNANASTVGNSSDGSEGETAISFRLQTMFGSGQFSSISSPILIDQFAWRTSPGTGPFSGTAAMVDVYASTSPRFPNLNGGPSLLMSSTFADNLGPDNTLVYHGPIALSSPGCPAGSTPCAFDVIFNLQTPFLYNPLQGRLLLDIFITNLNADGVGELDEVSFGDGFGPIASLIALAGNAAGEFQHGGDITQLRFTAVPEPATMTLMLSGLGAFAARRRYRARR